MTVLGGGNSEYPDVLGAVFVVFELALLQRQLFFPRTEGGPHQLSGHLVLPSKAWLLDLWSACLHGQPLRQYRLRIEQT